MSSRRRFQFRLRTLFVVVTVVAVILGTQALIVRPMISLTRLRTVYDENSWWMTAYLIDASAIGLGIWFVLRSEGGTHGPRPPA